MLKEQRTGKFCRAAVAGEGMHVVRVKRSRRGSDVTFCRTVARTRVTAAMPDIVDRFVEKAKEGSIAHVKALTAMSGMDQALGREDVSLTSTGRPPQSLATYLMRELKRQQREQRVQKDQGEAEDVDLARALARSR